MADLGLAGAGRAAGAAGALRQMIQDRLFALKAAADENYRQQQLAQQSKFQDAQMASLADERSANADLRKQNAAHMLTQDLTPGAVLDPTATGTLQAGNLGSLIEHQTPTLASTSTVGAMTTPTPGQTIQGAATSTPEAGHGAQDVYTGTPSQQRTAQTQKMLTGMLKSLPPDSPEAKALRYNLITHQAPPAGLLTDPGAKNQQAFDLFKQEQDYRRANPAPAPAAGQTSRLDRSYQVSSSKLDKMRQPIADRQARMSRLIDSVNQMTPQSDALVAPELLTVMAGGMGSGLRMNEAEIARIIGGRSNFESLKAALNKWQADPSKALSITPEQRNEIKALISTVAQRDTASLQAIDHAEQGLIDAPDVMTHRKILHDLNQQLTAMVPSANSQVGGGAKIKSITPIP